MKYTFLVQLLLFTCIPMLAQQNTDVSLFMKSDSSLYLDEISDEEGDLFLTIGHHGPAIENEWAAYRIYFDKRCAIDVYNKINPGLELKKAKWYPTVEQQRSGWGADYYKAGTTVGLGGVRLWDGEQAIMLDPVTMRTARVLKENGKSIMEMISRGVIYKGKKIDIMLRVTVSQGERAAKVEYVSLTDTPVQFATGINYHEGQDIKKADGLIATWGLHPEDVAAEPVKIGAALLFDPTDFVSTMDDGTQFLLISKESTGLETKILTASENEEKLNSFKKFFKYCIRLQ